MKDISFENLLKRCGLWGNPWIDPAIARIVLQQAQQSEGRLIPKLLSMQLMQSMTK